MAIGLKPQNQAKQPWPPPNKVQGNDDWASVAAAQAFIPNHSPQFWNHWKEMAGLCQEIPGVPSCYGNVLRITKNHCWVIGPYDFLKEVAKRLKWDEKKNACVDPDLLKALTDSNTRYGLRSTDIAPGARTKGELPGHVTRGQMGERTNPQGISKEVGKMIKDRDKTGTNQPRDTDYYPHLAKYWRGRTLEAHHIVEKGILEVLGENNGKLKDRVAPCVLAFAELHKRYFTPYFARKDGNPDDVDEESIRQHFKHVSSGKEAYAELVKVYRDLYSSEAMRELKTFAEIISGELQDKAKLNK